MRNARRTAKALLAGLLAAVALAAGAGSATAAPKVLIVGDSLLDLTSPHLPQYLPGVELTINADGGSNTFEILDLFESSYDPEHSVIVFDGGTNDNPNYPQILEENLGKVAAMVGDRCMVVPTVHGFTVEGTDNTGKNRVVRQFAAARPGTQTPDWATVATTRRDLMQSDGLHPTEAGADVRAQLIADGILGCLSALQTRAPAPLAETAAVASVETRDFEPVGRVARRERELLGEMGPDLARQLAALTAINLLVGR